jgi:hypothetical protein
MGPGRRNLGALSDDADIDNAVDIGGFACRATNIASGVSSLGPNGRQPNCSDRATGQSFRAALIEPRVSRRTIG